MAASGTTKRISVNNLLSSSPTASGALTVTGLVTAGSATITGAATVGTTLGVTGVSTFAAGTALLPALTTTGDTNTGIYYPAADTFAVTTAGTERYRVDSAGNVGIGNVPTTLWRSGARALQVGVNKYVSLHEQSAGGANLCFAAYESLANVFSYTTGDAPSRYVQISGAHQWYSAAAGTANAVIAFGDPKMTLDASGNLLIGTPSLIFGTPAGSLNIAAANTQQFIIRHTGATAGEFWRQAVDSSNTFYILNNATAGVSITSGATSWSAVSDERLKDIIEPISNAIAKVGSLRSVIGKYKNDETNIRRSFLIAQDVQSVLPEAVDSSKPNELGLRYTEVIPLLVAAIKELTTRVQTLEAR
jgi:hypothetical protein